MKLPVPHLPISEVLHEVDVHFRAPAATLSVWAVDALNAVERIAEALERIATAAESAHAAVESPAPLVVAR